MSKSKKARQPKIYMYGPIKVLQDMGNASELDHLLSLPGAETLGYLKADVVEIDGVEVPVAVWGYRRYMTKNEHAKMVRDAEAERAAAKLAEKEGEGE